MRIWLPRNLLTALLLFSPIGAADINRYTLDSPWLRELSGLAASYAHPGYYWGHNDSGAEGRLVLIHPQQQRLISVAVPGLGARDWEDIASFSDASGNYLLVGDVGDNFALRPMIDIYLLAEYGSANAPRLKLLRHFSLVFDGGPRDIEGLAVDSETRTAYLLSKRERHPTLYQFSLDALPATTIVLNELGPLRSLPSRAQHRPQREGGISQYSPTGVDFAANGRAAVISTLRDSYYFFRKPGQSWLDALNTDPVPLKAPRLRQAEAIALSTDGKEIILGSEGRPATLVHFTQVPPPRDE